MVNYRFVRHTSLALFAVSTLFVPLVAHAAAPAMLIDKPGAYALDKDIAVASGDAVMITASGVTLDLVLRATGHEIAQYELFRRELTVAAASTHL